MITLPRFQIFLDWLSHALAEIPPQNRIAFGASCCERSIPNYREFSTLERWGNPALLRTAVDRAWNFVRGGSFSAEEAQIFEREIEAATPDSEDFLGAHADAAREAAFMAALLLQCCHSNDPTLIARIASFARDTADMLVQVEENLDPNDPELESKIEKHPRMTRELSFQQEDLASLGRIGTQDELQAFEIRARHRVA